MVSLLAGERLLWEGQPQTGLLWRPIELLLVPFSLLWAGFALFWNIGVWQAHAPLFMRLFGIPFLLAGAYVTVGRFVFDSWLRARTSYLVTDRRVIIRRPLAADRSLDIRRLPTLELEERGDGIGTLRFESAPSLLWRSNGFGLWSPAAGASAQFLGVSGARAVYELIARQAA